MLMTELLHMHDNYIKEFDAKIIDIGENFVVLDRTAFYPEGGGQAGDAGWLSDGTTEITVTKTIKSEGQVRHLVDVTPPFTVGQTIHGRLDWDSRYRCMRFHTAQHVLSRFLLQTYGLETVGNNITPTKSRADYHPLEIFDDEMKHTVEDGVNEIFARGLDVRIEFMPRNEAISFLKEKGYQVRYLEMVPKSVKTFRVVIIDDYDASSCAGTHVANTREIGKIHIGKTKNVGAGKRRIYFTLE